MLKDILLAQEIQWCLALQNVQEERTNHMAWLQPLGEHPQPRAHSYLYPPGPCLA